MGNATRIAARQTINGDGALAEYRSPAHSAEKRARGGGRFFLSLTLALVLAAVAILALPRDAHAVEVGDFKVVLTETSTDPEIGTHYEYNSGVLTIKTSTPLTISMGGGVTETTTDTIVTEAEGATVTLKDVRIDVSGVASTAAMSVASGSLNLTLAGDTDSFLKSGYDRAGLENGVNTLVIGGEGTLEAVGGHGAAGIGSRFRGLGRSDITITGDVKVMAVGGPDEVSHGGAGIGCGSDSPSSSNITISGSATVEAEGGAGAAGIGGSYAAVVGNISISGGYVRATAGDGADPIGNGNRAVDDADVSITGGAFPGDAVSEGKVYGVGLTSGYVLGANEDDHKEDFPHRVYSTGDFSVEGGAYGTDYEYASNVLTVTSSTSLTISMKESVDETKTDTIVTAAADATVTLKDVRIDVSGVAGAAAMSVVSGSLSLVLEDGTANSLKSGNNCAGLQNGAYPLTISGSGSLEAAGGSLGAGIGGGSMRSGSNIAILGSVAVTATGGVSSGAGIGGGYAGGGSNIKILDSAEVTATGGLSAAGIGGGNSGGGLNIAISGGYVKAVAESPGAEPIGNGSGKQGTSGVSITGGAFPEDAVAGIEVYGVGLTSGYVLGANEDDRVDEYPHRVYSTGDFSVKGGAYGTDYEYDSNVLAIKSSTPLTISMKEGVTNPTTDTIVTEAEGAKVTLAGVNIDVSKIYDAAAIYIASGTLDLVLAEGTKSSLKSGFRRAGLENGELPLTIFGSGSLEAQGGLLGAGIGGGSEGDGSNITISGNAQVTATGINGGAGIGGGDGSGGKGGDGSNITISESAQVKATGGDGSGAAAGIGGGAHREGSNIAISGGYVEAVAGTGISSKADPIGGGTSAQGTSGVSITGGAFADSAWADGKVYGIEPASGFALGANTDALADEYPVRAYSTGDFHVTGGEYGKDYEYGFTDGLLQTLGKLTVKDGAELTISMREGADDPTGDVIEVPGGKAHVILAGVNIDASGQDGVAALSVTGESLDLVLAPETANSLKSAANRAGLQKSRDNSLSISGSGSLEARGSGGGAGIGGGQGGHASNISISGSVQVTAMGGALAAGIGGGYQGSGTSISISGGYVKAVSGSNADPIGGGPDARGTSGVTITGGAFPGDAVSDSKVYGVTLSEDYLAAENNDTDESLRASYPVRVYTIQDPTLAFKDEPQDFEYDGSPINPTALIETAKRGDTDASADVTWSYSIVDSTDKTDIAPTNAGTYNVVAILPAAIVGGVPYREATVEGEMTISPKPLTATVNSTDDSAERTYDGTTAFTGVDLELEGVVSNDDVSATAEGTAASKDAGEYAFTVSSTTLSGTAKGNYSLATSDVSGNVIITKRDITATSVEVADKTYDKTTDATIGNIEFENLVEGESLALGTDYTASASFESADVGEGKKVNVTSIALVTDGPVAKNYFYRGPSQLTTPANITQAEATIELTVDNSSPAYGETVTFTATQSLATTTFSTREAIEPTFEFYVVDANKVERTLGTKTGMTEEGDVTFTYDTRGQGLAIGPNTVYARSSGFGNLVDAISDPITVTLAPKTVEPTVAVTGTTTKPYDGTTDLPEDAVSTVGLSGLVGGDNVSATASFAFASADAHTTQVNATDITLSGPDAGFYLLSEDAASVDAPGGITRADALNLSASATMPNYLSDYEARIDLAELLPNGATDAAFSVAPDASYSGLVSAHVEGNELVLVADDAGNTTSDEVAVAVTSMNNYENSTITVAVSYTAKPMAYFAIQSVDGTYTGAPQAGFDASAGATYIAPDGTTQVYAGPFEASYKAASPGPSPSTPAPPTAVGTYEVTVSLPDDAPCAGSATVTFEIAKAPLTVTALDAAAVYGDAAPPFEVSFDGFVAAEGAGALAGELAFACAYDAGDPVGSYAITASGLSSDNYAISYKPGMLAISPKALSATVDAADPSASKNHDGTAGFQDVKLVLAGALDGDDVSGVADGAAADAAAGEGKPFAASTVRLSGDDMRNYVLDPADVVGTVTIVAAPTPDPEPTPDPDPEPLPAPNGGSGSGSGEKPTPLPGAAAALAPTGDATAALAFAALALAALSTAVLVAARLRRRTD
ncbi:hypothetical protein H8S61_10800 [Eggerthella sp. NSJ-70]|uniref:MBG domain-containing protein n=1 Tax=Eggerthella hominis TaxID=2763043 RepID=A0ABR7BSW0_9ACTN|nr:YDG domain-containing protein [Eggerthella hominis]MBC5584676.1 hypothetical protein [Eggerthella hominis]